MARVLLLAAALTATAGAVRPECRPFTDKNQYYFGSNGLVMSAVQVETGRHDIPKASGDYFRRFVTALKQRGTELIVIPVPRSGFTFSGTLDASEIEGSVFAKGNHPDFKKQALDAYQSSIANLASYGVTAADFMSAANTELTRNPKKQLFFLQDGHWRPEGAEVAAKAVATTLAAKLPSLKEQISTKEFKLVPGPVTQRNGFGWDVRVKLDCPNTKWQPLVEPYPTVKAELVSGGDLLSDDEFPVYLAGTSYSADSYKMGLESYLKKALGTDLTNIAINGGEAMSSMLDFYTFKTVDELDPRLIVWEIPTQFLDFTSANSFSPITLRQLLPLVAQGSSLIQAEKIENAAGVHSIDIRANEVKGSDYYLEFTFDKFESRALEVELISASGTEVVKLAKERGRATKRYTLELSPESFLKKVTVKAPADAKGSLQVQVRKYGVAP